MSCENCKSNIDAERSAVNSRVDSIVARVGGGRDKTIPLLQALQEEFSYLPSDALERVYQTTDITRANLLSVATFYSQFRLIPYGKHIIKVCIGTACHVKGAGAVYDAFRRELDIAEDSVTTADGRYSVEKIACLGCCALAPVVQIDDQIYGNVQPGRVKSVIAEYENYLSTRREKADDEILDDEFVGEVRLGMENCCQVSGNADVYKAVVKAQQELGIAIKIKSISCVGACNQVPMIDVVERNGNITRYPNVRPQEIKEILLHHFPAASIFKRIKNTLLNQVDMLHTDQTWDNILYLSEQKRTREINSFLKHQVRISTEGYGHINPLDLEEYCAHGGFEALKKALTDGDRDAIIDNVLKSGIRGRGGGGFPTGRKWQIVKSAKKEQKYIICNGDEGDPGAFMDRILLESYPLRVIEGMLIAAYAVGASKGIFYIRAEYPQAQGSDEPTTEAQAMADYLTERGISSVRIFLEEQSHNTVQNFRYSRQLMEDLGYDPEETELLVVSNGFHLTRSRMLAGRTGFEEISTLAAPSSHLPSRLKMYVREPLALVKSFLVDR